MHLRHGEELELVAAKVQCGDPSAMPVVDLEGVNVPEEDLAEIRGRMARISPPDTCAFRNNFMTQLMMHAPPADSCEALSCREATQSTVWSLARALATPLAWGNEDRGSSV